MQFFFSVLKLKKVTTRNFFPRLDMGEFQQDKNLIKNFGKINMPKEQHFYCCTYSSHLLRGLQKLTTTVHTLTIIKGFNGLKK